MMQELVQRIQDMCRDTVNCIHTSIPGEIVSFDPVTCLAVVKPMMQYKKPNGEKMDYPNVHDVPVLIPQGAEQTVAIAYPIRSGDGCLLIVSEEALDYWRYQRETATDLHFDLTNSIAVVGLNVKPIPGIRQACENGAVVITAGDTVLTVSPAGVGVIGNVTVRGTITATGDVTSGAVSLQRHTHTCPDGGNTSAAR